MERSGYLTDEVDFEAFYQGKPTLEGVDVGFDVAPWDIGEPQPAVVELADSGALGDSVLDAGCGPGDNAIFLAGRGYRLTGVDGSETALENARQRAGDLDVAFVRTDAATLHGLSEGFDTVLDSALYHCLNDEQRHSYAAALHRVSAPDAQLHLFCFAEDAEDGFRVPMAVSPEDLREHLGTHWKIRDITSTDYVTAMTLDMLARIERSQLEQAGFAIDESRLRTDEQGRILGRMWHLHADRA